MDTLDTPRYYGLYRGIALGSRAGHEVLVSVPELSGSQPLGWAMPCIVPKYPPELPMGIVHPPGDQHWIYSYDYPPNGSPASAYTLTWNPRRGSGVWVMFEQGDPSKPVWMGVWRGPEIG